MSSAQTHDNVQRILSGQWATLDDALQAAMSWIDEDLKLSTPRLINKINKLPYQALVVLIYLICMLPIVSCAVVVYFFYHDTDKNDSFRNHNRFTYGIYISAFITVMLTLSVGIESLLVFIPKDWGGFDEDGDWRSSREEIALLLSFLSTYFIANLLSKYQKLKEKMQSLDEQKKNKNINS